MISVFGCSVGEREAQAVTQCLESQWLGLGKKVEEFEAAFGKLINSTHFMMVDTGSNALYMAVRLLDLPPKSKIIVPSLTWVSCGHAVMLAGHIPVFVDVDPVTMNITKETIEQRLTPDVKAIMVVHYAGLPVDMDAIVKLGLPIIEDAAHAPYSTYKGKACGTIGDIGIYSFNAVKNIATGDGGGIVCRDEETYKIAKTLRYCGIGKSGFEVATSVTNGKWWEYHIAECFIRMLPNNVAASIGIVQLERRNELQSRREQIWKVYNSILLDTEVRCPTMLPETTHSFYTYCITAPRRDELARHLFENNIYTTFRYHPLHLNPIYKQTNISLPNCERLNNVGLNIPIHPRLTIDEAYGIAQTIRSFYGS